MMAAASMAAESTVAGFAPDSIYAKYSVEEREVSDRMEAVYNHERGLDVHTITDTGRARGSHFSRNPLRFTPNDSLRRLAKTYGRQIEDIEAGGLCGFCESELAEAA